MDKLSLSLSLSVAILAQAPGQGPVAVAFFWASEREDHHHVGRYPPYGAGKGGDDPLVT